MNTSPDSPAPESASGHARNGRVATLPKTLRDTVCTMMRDAVPYKTILETLRAEGHHLAKSSLTRWRNGGYKDWLREQLWLDEMRVRLDFASKLVTKDKPSKLQEAGLIIASTQVIGLLLNCNTDSLTEGLKDHPQNYVRLVTTLCRLSHDIIAIQKHRDSLDSCDCDTQD